MVTVVGAASALAGTMRATTATMTAPAITELLRLFSLLIFIRKNPFHCSEFGSARWQSRVPRSQARLSREGRRQQAPPRRRTRSAGGYDGTRRYAQRTVRFLGKIPLVAAGDPGT